MSKIDRCLAQLRDFGGFRRDASRDCDNALSQPIVEVNIRGTSNRCVRPRIVALVGVLAFLGVSYLSLSDEIKVQHDSGVYIALAKSLCTLNEYRDVYLVNKPVHTKYPPVLPVLLTPLSCLSGYNVVAMKVLMILIATVALYNVYKLLKRLADPVTAGCVTVFTATAPGIVFYSQSIMSEIPYLLFSLLAIGYFYHSSERHNWTKGSVAFLMILFSLAYLTRSIGLSLLPASFMYFILDSEGTFRNRLLRGVTICGILAVPAILWFLRNELVSTTQQAMPYWNESYAYLTGLFDSQEQRERASDLARIARNPYRYAIDYYRAIFFYSPLFLGKFVPLMLSLTVFAGFLWCSVHRRTIVEYYIVAYMLAALFFPGTRPSRYVVPLIPFIWYYLFIAGRTTLSFFSQNLGNLWHRVSRPTAALCRISLVVLLVSNSIAALRVNSSRDGYYHVVGEDGYVNIVPWATSHTLPSSVFMWAKPSLRFLQSGRQSLAVARTNDQQAILAGIEKWGVDYVVLDSFSTTARRYLEPVVTTHPRRFSLVYSGPVSSVYRVVPPPNSSRIHDITDD